jgi:hypothetical protein
MGSFFLNRMANGTRINAENADSDRFSALIRACPLPAGFLYGSEIAFIIDVTS